MALNQKLIKNHQYAFNCYKVSLPAGVLVIS